MIQNLLLWAAITSLVIQGFTIVSSEGFLLYPLRKWLDKVLEGTHLHEPIIGCHICMASLWGAAAFFIAVLSGAGFAIYHLPIFLLVVAGLNNFFWREV